MERDTERKSRKRKKGDLEDEEDGVAPASRRSKASSSTASVTDLDDTGVEFGFAEMSQVTADLGLIESAMRPAECGIIEKISLKNFMCHSNLDVQFGPNATILSGKNGSGKSAVLVAIVVGLGGAATLTKRGQSVKTFIKEGCSSACVTIKIKNCGDGAYLAQEYGDSIVVERRINSDSTGSYRIRTAAEKVVATTKEDLTRILDHFNIQVDNPVCVLQQDMSRSFMHTTSAKDKYKFFMQATQLDVMCRNYREIIDYKEELFGLMEMKKSSMPKLERDVAEKEQRFKELERQDKMEEKKTEIEADLAWAQVTDLEAVVTETRAAAQEKEKRLPQYDKKIAECEQAVQNANDELAQLRTGLDEIRKETSAITGSYSDKLAELRQQKLILRNAQVTVQDVKSKIKQAEADRLQFVEAITGLRQEATCDREAESKERAARLEQLRHELQEVQDRLRESNEFKVELESALRSHQVDTDTLKSDLGEAQRRANQQQRRLEQLRSSVQNRVQVFGRGYVDLVRWIDAAAQQRKFHKKPVGPIGMHVKLRDKKWALAVEASVTRGLLGGFVVDNGEDKRILQQLIRECRLDRRPTIYISKFLDRAHDVSRNKAGGKHPAVTDMLDIDNPVVFNCLVDQRNIECHVLVDDPGEARSFIWSNPPPARCTTVYTGAGDVAYPDRTYQSNKVEDVFCLQHNMEDEIEHVQQEVDRCRAAMAKLSNERAQLDASLNDINKELGNCRNKLNRDQDKSNRLQGDVAELADNEEDAPIDVATLEEDVHNCDMKIEELRNELLEAEEQVNEIMPVLKQQQQEQQTFAQQREQVAARAESIKSDIAKADHALGTAKQHLAHYRSSRDGKLKDFQQLEAEALKHEEKAQCIEETVKQAYPERSTSRRSVKHLESELKQIERALKEKEKSQGCRQEITADYHEVSERFTRLSSEIKVIDKLGKRLVDAMSDRQKTFKRIRDKVETRLKVHFYLFMSKRGYEGNCQFDHGEETLEMQVKVVGGAKLTKDTKTLSGGERSFSMVAFILALWDVMETPFRCLDEFDVFMDLVNRRNAMEMLLSAANTNRRRQFILLTPQDLSDWSNKDYVRILRMKDPVRNQPTLDDHLVPV